MYRLLPLLGDVGLGILSVIFVSLAYGERDMWAFILLPLILLPDLDAIPEITKKGKVAASKENPHDHRELLHKPILWFIATGFFWREFGYYGAIAFTMVAFHFIHDSVFTGWGVPWLWPSRRRFKFLVDEKNEFSFARKDWLRSWNEDELTTAIVTYGDENWIENLYLKPTVVSSVEYGVFFFSIFLLIGFLSA